MKVKELFVLVFLLFVAVVHGSCQYMADYTFKDAYGFVFARSIGYGGMFRTTVFPKDSRLLPKNADGKMSTEYLYEYDFLKGQKQFADTVKKYFPEKVDLIRGLGIVIQLGFTINSKGEAVDGYIGWSHSS